MLSLIDSPTSGSIEIFDNLKENISDNIINKIINKDSK